MVDFFQDFVEVDKTFLERLKRGIFKSLFGDTALDRIDEDEAVFLEIAVEIG